MSAHTLRVKFETIEHPTIEELALASLESDERVIICGSLDEQALLQVTIADEERAPEEIVEASAKIDAEAWLAQRKAEILAEYEEDGNDGVPVGEMQTAEAEPSQGLVLVTDVLSGARHESTLVCRLSAPQSWHIPAEMAIGGWNECPDAEVHCALWKRWQERYDAHIIAVSHDVVEAYVGAPPQTPEEALQLAWEQYIYCQDIVEQGTVSIANLAATLLDTHTWYFWWD